jgi:hypothetical protein
MKQQINLYQPVVIKGSGLVASSSVLIALSAVTVLLLGIYVYGLYAVMQLSHHVDAAREQQQKQTALLTLNAANASIADVPALQAQVRALTAILSDHKRALQLLRVGVSGGDSGFSERLIALANQHVDGMWLDHIVMGSANGIESIGGGTINSELVPIYLSQLASEPALHGTHINQFDITGRNVVTDAGGKPSSAIQFRAINTSSKVTDKDQSGKADAAAKIASDAPAGRS